MGTLKIQLPQTLPSSSSSSTTTPLMNTFSGNFRARLRFSSNFRVCCTSSVELKKTHESVNGESGRKIGQQSRAKARVKMSETQLKEGWLSSLSCPFPNKANGSILEDPKSNFDGLEWVIGVDPDVSGALAVLKSDDSGCSAQVFDTPHLQVLVGKRIRKRLDAKSIVQLLRSFDAPPGTTAFIEQSIPFPQDGKQGWWCGGFGYGLWIGILVASGFSVVPVPSSLWKNHFELSGSRMLKDESRKVACTLFPSMTPLLKRKKDHGRAEALLIAAYGKTRQMKPEPCVM